MESRTTAISAPEVLILLHINPALTLLLFCFLPLMTVYALIFSRRLNAALLRSQIRIGDVNAQVEDSLTGSRDVQAFTGEPFEQQRFDAENQRFVESRRDGYVSDAYFFRG